jgi:N-acetylmuramoyl-L-alanine amidase
LTFARHLTLLLLAAAPLVAPAQNSTPTQAPAPIVRTTPDAEASKPSTPKPPTISPAAALALLQPGPFNRTVVVLDPAHGGGDTGARINDQIVEKDIDLALAFRLRSLLSARGFNVIMTRDSDGAAATPAPPLSLDDRAGIANRARPVACLLLHATASGAGVHLYTSELDPTPGEAVPAAWLTAQAAWVAQSQRLASQMGAAIGRAKIPLVVSRASVRPVDSLTCPALVIELAPNGSDASTLNDTAYQQRVAEALADALVLWKTQAQPPTRLAPPPPPPVPAATPSEATP